MLKSIKSLAKDSVIYGLAELLNRALQVILLPLIFIYISKDSFGILDYLFAIKNLLNVFLGYGLTTAIQRFNIYAKDYPKELIIPTSLSVILFFDIIINVIIFFLGDRITLFIMGDSLGWDFFLISLTSTFFALRSIPLGVLRLRRKAFSYLVCSISYFVAYIALTYLFIKELDMDYSSFIYGGLLAVSFSLALGIYYIRKDLIFRFNFQLAREILLFGLSILMSSTATVLIMTMNRFFLKIHGSFEDVAILGMSNRLSYFVGAFLVAPFNLAWLPYVNTHYKDGNFVQVVNKIIEIFTGIGLTLTLIFYLFGGDVLIFLGDTEYSKSIDILPFFCFGFVFQGYYFIATSGLFVHSKRDKYVKISIFTFLISLVLYFTFINVLSVAIVSLITLAGFILMFGLGYYFGNEWLNLKFHQKSVIAMWSFAIIIVVANLIDPLYVLESSIGTKLMYLLAYVLFVTTIVTGLSGLKNMGRGR